MLRRNNFMTINYFFGGVSSKTLSEVIGEPLLRKNEPISVNTFFRAKARVSVEDSLSWVEIEK